MSIILKDLVISSYVTIITLYTFIIIIIINIIIIIIIHSLVS